MEHISISVLIEKNRSGGQIDATQSIGWVPVSSGGFIETYRFRSSSKILVITLDSRLQIDGDHFRELIEVIAEELKLIALIWLGRSEKHSIKYRKEP